MGQKSSHSLGHGADTPASALLSTPYEWVAPLGRGGMGEVHLIEHTFLKRRFALKIVRPQFAGHAQLADRMRLEAQAAARLSHPHIVKIVDFWIASGKRPCMVMELLEGETVARELLRRRRLPTPEALRYTCQLLSALEAAHELGIIHRDIKPENLFLHHEADHGRILKVLDFGIARVMPEASELAPQPLNVPTKTGTFLGSPKYASPETLRGEPVDHRSDVFSAGLVCYTMLTGRGAFDRMSANEDWSIFVPEPPSRHVGRSVPPELDAVILKAISHGKSNRFQNARAFAAELLPFSEGAYVQTS